MSASGGSLLALAAILLLLVLHWIARTWRAALEDAWLPRDLQDAEMAYAELRFLAKGPIELVARVDRVYRHRDGMLTLVELKTREVNRVYFSDVIELSAQRYALQAHTREPAARQAYVLIHQVGQQQTTVHRVTLLANEQVVALVKRRDAILAGMAEPQYTRWPKLCSQCPFKHLCKPLSENEWKKSGND